MKGRQLLHRILNRQSVDRLSWTTLADDVTRAGMTDDVRRLSTIEFYRYIGCDIVQLGNYGLAQELRVPSPARLVCPDVKQEVLREDGSPLTQEGEPVGDLEIGTGGLTVDQTVTVRRGTPWGTLTTLLKHDHPVEHPVKSVEDLRILRAIWEASDYVENQDMEEAFARVERHIGDDGIYVPWLDPSPVQNLLEYEMGAANFYYLLADHRREVEELLAVMHAKRLQEYEIVARRTPAEVVIAMENTSSTLISPQLYRQYSVPQIRDYVDVLHRHGKIAVLHMCGHLKALLPAIRETGLDGINAATPPPVGTATFDEILDAFGDDFLLFGAILAPTVFHKAGLDCGELSKCLDNLYTPRLRRARLVLWLAVDGLTTPLERFQCVAQWMAANGCQKCSVG
jgi:hypothetical protein